MKSGADVLLMAMFICLDRTRDDIDVFMVAPKALVIQLDQSIKKVEVFLV